MKKLFILTPAMLLTAMMYSADMSTITVTLQSRQGGGGAVPENFTKEFQVNLNHETFESLAEKIHNSDLTYHDRNITYFTWGKNFMDSQRTNKFHEKADASKLRDAGISYGAKISVFVD